MRTPQGSILELSKLRSRVTLGRLAENYDGVGQYVLVSLSQGSTAAVYKARVAAGDFGGGRVIPVGTRVPVTVVRGQLEVLLGNIPKVGCPHNCRDAFKRSVAGGWGCSPINCTLWQSILFDGSTLEVNGSQGILHSGISLNVVYLETGSQWSLPIELLVLMRWTESDAAGNPSFNVIADVPGQTRPLVGIAWERISGNMGADLYSYLDSELIDAGLGGITAGAASNYGAEPFWTRIRLSETSGIVRIEARSWLTTEDEPVGVWPLFATSSVGAPYSASLSAVHALAWYKGHGGELYVDELYVESGLDCATPGACLETFSRTTTAGLGTSEIGPQPWFHRSIPDGFDPGGTIYVDGSKAVIPSGSSPGYIHTYSLRDIAFSTPFQWDGLAHLDSNGVSECTLDIGRFDGTDYYDGVTFPYPAQAAYLEIYQGSPNNGFMHAFLVAGTSSTSNYDVPNTSQIGPDDIRWRVRIDATSISAKIWAVTDPEPGSWSLVLALPGGLTIPYPFIGFWTGADQVYEVDTIQVTEGCAPAAPCK